RAGGVDRRHAAAARRRAVYGVRDVAGVAADRARRVSRPAACECVARAIAEVVGPLRAGAADARAAAAEGQAAAGDGLALVAVSGIRTRAAGIARSGAGTRAAEERGGDARAHAVARSGRRARAAVVRAG